LPPIELRDTRSLVALLENTINGVRGGTLQANTANCIGYLAGIALKALQASDLEKRIEMIEAIMGKQKRK
jgi:hypothetical protein